MGAVRDRGRRPARRATAWGPPWSWRVGPARRRKIFVTARAAPASPPGAPCVRRGRRRRDRTRRDSLGTGRTTTRSAANALATGDATRRRLAALSSQPTSPQHRGCQRAARHHARPSLARQPPPVPRERPRPESARRSRSPTPATVSPTRTRCCDVRRTLDVALAAHAPDWSGSERSDHWYGATHTPAGAEHVPEQPHRAQRSQGRQNLGREGFDHGVGPAQLTQCLGVALRDHGEQGFVLGRLRDLRQHLPVQGVLRGAQVQFA